MNSIKILILLVVVVACQSPSLDRSFVTGNIFFCSYDGGELSGAIDAVTQTAKATHYSHMGIIEMHDADTFLIHATTERGVVREKLSQFLAIDQPAVVDIYTLPHLKREERESAVLLAKEKVGLPYNYHYMMNDTCYYCSQLVYEAYDSRFVLEPMTFKNTDTNSFNLGWIKHYQNLGLPIPEGELGCNPNGMINNSELLFLERVR